MDPSAGLVKFTDEENFLFVPHDPSVSRKHCRYVLEAFRFGTTKLIVKMVWERGRESR